MFLIFMSVPRHPSGIERHGGRSDPTLPEIALFSRSVWRKSLGLYLPILSRFRLHFSFSQMF